MIDAYMVCRNCVLILCFQLYEGEKPVRMVDGWNAWYFNKLEQVVSLGDISHYMLIMLYMVVH